MTYGQAAFVHVGIPERVKEGSKSKTYCDALVSILYSIRLL